MDVFHLADTRIAIELLSSGKRELRMNDDAGCACKDVEISRIAPYDAVILVIYVLDQSTIAVRRQQATRKISRPLVLMLTPLLQMTQIEVVQHDGARMPLKQAEHLLVEMRISKVVDDSVKLFCVPVEPVEISDCQVAAYPRVADFRLIDDDINIIVTCQFRKQLCAVIGDASLCRRHGRNVCKACTEGLGDDKCSRNVAHLRCRFHGGQGTFRAVIP